MKIRTSTKPPAVTGNIMRQRDHLLRIDNPCREEWILMGENGKGRFCAHCSKTVIDFTKLTDNEIIKILETSSGKLCGRFSDQQLGRIIEAEKSVNNSKFYKILAGVLLIGGILRSSSVSSQTPTKTEIVSSNDYKSGTIQANATNSTKEDSLKNVVRGIVLDSAKREPLLGVLIRIKDSKIGTLTDKEGRFSLKIPDSLLTGQVTLLVEYIGFKTLEKTIETKNWPIKVKFILGPSVLTLGEVCIIKKKKWWQFWQ